jgi:membrane associated rhomboid family serine protease
MDTVPARAEVRPGLAAAPAAAALAALNLAVHAWAASQGALDDPALLVQLGALERGRVWDGEVWRLLSAAFLHGGWWHAAGNALGILLAGGLVERALGKARFVGIYLASALGGSALSLLGHDAVAAGASGAVLGTTGALVALHLRRCGSWRAFVSSRGTHLLAAALAAGALGTFFLRDVMPPDDLAHAGGFVTGAFAGWAASGPPGRARARARWRFALFAGGLAALCTAAAWPRGGVPGFESLQLQREIHAALRREDTALASRLAAAARARGVVAPALDYYEALLAAHEDRLEPALGALRALLDTPDPRLREEARRAAARVARLLGYRAYTGDGRPRDAHAGLAYLEESCALGEEQSCRDAEAITRLPVAP